MLEGLEGMEKCPEIKVPPLGPEDHRSDLPRWVVSHDGTCGYEYFDPSERIFALCLHRGTKDYCGGREDRSGSAVNATSTILLGDSHTDKLAEVLFQRQPELKKEKGWMSTKYHGAGIYLNSAPHYDFKGYVAGKKKAKFSRGKMLTNLESGRYKSLQIENGFSTWIFRSGHWEPPGCHAG